MIKIIYKFILILLCVSVIFCADEASAKKRPKAKTPLLSAKSAIVTDARNGKALFSRSFQKRLPPASTVKLMTALVAIEKIKLDKDVFISRKSACMQPSKACLTEGAIYKAYDLLEACLMASSNDASVALAEAVAGTEWDFVLMMNEKARRLGMRNTRFMNSTGLPVTKARQYSTAEDLSTLMRAVAKKNTLLSIMGKKQATIYGSDGKAIHLANHNRLLFKKSRKNIYLKTGYTKSSGHCFAGIKIAGRKQYIFAFLGSKKPWSDVNYLVGNR